MLKIPSKNEQRYFVRPNSSFPVSPTLLLNDSDGRSARELWWTKQESFPADIILPCFFMLIYHLRDKQ
jgi:hypothetical protein